MILDTSVLVDLDRGRNIERVEKINDKWAGISAATFMEVATGKHREEIPNEDFNLVEENLEVIPITNEIADRAGKIMAELLDRGEMIGINDIYIAATALELEQSLLTADTEDFEKIEGLEVIDWEKV